MKVAIVYTSIPNYDTHVLLEKISNNHNVDLIDGQLSMKMNLTEYDLIGILVGDCHGRFYRAFRDYIYRYFPEGKEIFFMCIPGNPSVRKIEKILSSKNCTIKDRYCCKGQDKSSSFKLFGRRKDRQLRDEDLNDAVEFYEKMIR